jgi:hypothetical protein
MFHAIARSIGTGLARFLNQSTGDYEQFSITPEHRLKEVLRPGDILLVEGKTRISSAIKYLTQSTWSHAAIYVGDATPCRDAGDGHVIVEADIVNGVVAVPLGKYGRYNTRICRAIGISDEDRGRIVDFVCNQIGHRYDLKNIFDLLRYFLPASPVPARFRRQLLAFGSSDPTRAICSTLIAQAFQSLEYPILPRRAEDVTDVTPVDGVLEMRHYSHFVPRDFDLSPYFRVVKPTLQTGFDYHSIVWSEGTAPEATS